MISLFFSPISVKSHPSQSANATNVSKCCDTRAMTEERARAPASTTYTSTHLTKLQTAPPSIDRSRGLVCRKIDWQCHFEISAGGPLQAKALTKHHQSVSYPAAEMRVLQSAECRSQIQSRKLYIHLMQTSQRNNMSRHFNHITLTM